MKRIGGKLKSGTMSEKRREYIGFANRTGAVEAAMIRETSELTCSWPGCATRKLSEAIRCRAELSRTNTASGCSMRRSKVNTYNAIITQ